MSDEMLDLWNQINEETEEPYHGLAPFEKGSDTSLDAAYEIQPAKDTLQYEVWCYIRECGDYGATDDEIEQVLDLRHQTASARRRELELKGLVQKTPRRRPTRSGRNAAVYVVLEGRVS